MSHMDDPNEDQDLQSLINYWHDATGHARTLIGCPPGTCIHLNGLMGTVSPMKDLRPIDISSHVALPCRVNDTLEWHGFTVVAVSYHLGMSFTAGHWGTVIWLGMPWNRWLNYEDGQLPDVSVNLPSIVRSNWCVVWLASQPRFDC